MTPPVPTTKIVNKQNKGKSPFLTINSDTFDPKKHTVYDDSIQESASKKAAVTASKPWNPDMTVAELLVVGKKSYDMDLNPRGTKIDLLAELDKAWAAAAKK